MTDQRHLALERQNAEIIANPHLRAALTEARAAGAAFVCGSGNAGDGLIHLGAFQLFETVDWAPRIINEAAIAREPDGATVVVVGGAMIEGIWEERMRALRGFLERGGRVVLLPCTIAGFHDVLKTHADRLTIFAREQSTFDNVRAAGVSAVWTAHDLAFAVAPAFYQDLVSDRRRETLCAFRSDAERARAEIPIGNLDLSFLWNGAVWTDPALIAERCTLLGRLLASFELVRTDRLHIGIFAALVGTRVELHASIGSKLPGVYRQSLHAFTDVGLVETEPTETPDGTWVTRDALLEESINLAKLRREWYEPELQRLHVEVTRLDGLRRDWYEPELERRREAVEAARVGAQAAERAADEARSVTAALRTENARLEALLESAAEERSDFVRSSARQRRQVIVHAEQATAATDRIHDLEIRRSEQEARIAELDARSGRPAGRARSPSRRTSPRTRGIEGHCAFDPADRGRDGLSLAALQSAPPAQTPHTVARPRNASLVNAAFSARRRFAMNRRRRHRSPDTATRHGPWCA